MSEIPFDIPVGPSGGTPSQSPTSQETAKQTVPAPTAAAAPAAPATVSEPAVSPTLSELSEITTTTTTKTETPSEILSSSECVPWHKNRWVLGALFGLGLLALLFLILYLSNRGGKKCPGEGSPPGECPVCPPCQGGSTEKPTCPKPEQIPCVCPECEKCKKLTWELLQEGMGITEQGDHGFRMEITSETNSLEKAQDWVLRKRGIGLSYPVNPCMGSSCVPSFGEITTPAVQVMPSNSFYYSYAPYVRTTFDVMYRSYSLNLV